MQRVHFLPENCGFPRCKTCEETLIAFYYTIVETPVPEANKKT